VKKQWAGYSLIALALTLLIGLVTGCITIPDETSSTAATLSVLPPVINSFTASPAIIDSGQSVTLSWSASGATAVTVQPILNSADTTGITQVFPAASTAYTIIATNEAGSVTSFVSVIVKPVSTPDGRKVIGVDPVTGRNSDIGFEWEQLCLTNRYQVQIAKDSGFALMVFDSGVYTPSVTTDPALLYMAGGRLEAGHTYYWRARVRQAVTGQALLGPWSAPQTFIIGAGYPVTASYQGIALLSPVSGCSGYPVRSVPFTWSPYAEITRYRFTLAKDAELTNIIVKAEVATTSYVYTGMLDHNTNYFWQVTGIQPAPSDPSPIFSFTTEAKPLPESKALEPSFPAMPLWAWIVIGSGIALIIVVIVLIVTTKQV
jgi:hypothetical protein